MVEPTQFFLNEETFSDNKFMNKVDEDKEATSKKAIEEFHNLADKLKTAGVTVEMYSQMAADLPDSCFPNNWFSTHRTSDFPEGIFCLYPMRTPSREREKNPAIISAMKQRYSGFVDL